MTTYVLMLVEQIDAHDRAEPIWVSAMAAEVAALRWLDQRVTDEDVDLVVVQHGQLLAGAGRREGLSWGMGRRRLTVIRSSNSWRSFTTAPRLR